jgi:F-type H+-transporting ATPase subunit epsilon
MTTSVMRLDIVSAEQEIFSADVLSLTVSGSNGDLGIYPGHSQLLTELKPGNLQVLLVNNLEEIFFINGGLLEVQPFVVTVLSDTAIRASDLDEAAVIAAKQAAEHKLNSQAADIDFAAATAELAAAIAQITAIQKLRKRH